MIQHFKTSLCVFLLVAVAAGASAQDVITRNNGVRQAGRVVSADAQFVRVEAVIMQGQPPAQIAIPKSDIKRIDFAETRDIAAFVASPKAKDYVEVYKRWKERESMLSLPGSAAGALGLAYGELLIVSKDPAQRAAALVLFEKISREAWDPAHKAAASLGRLRALIANGRAKEAVEESKRVAQETDDPAILSEARYVLAEGALAELKKLIEDNPRWQEDIRVRPERHRLYHEALDLFLFAPLFAGANAETAPRGLWGAIRVHQVGATPGDLASARELARDIVVLYPQSPLIPLVEDFVKSLPQEIQKQDHEKDAS